MNQNMTGARVKPQHPGAPMARDSITDSTFQQFGTPSSYAGVARAGLAATPWVQELAQMGLQRAGDLGQYAAAGPAQLAALQQEAAANTGARAGLQQIEQAGLGGLGAMQRVMGLGLQLMSRLAALVFVASKRLGKLGKTLSSNNELWLA